MPYSVAEQAKIAADRAAIEKAEARLDADLAALTPDVVTPPPLPPQPSISSFTATPASLPVGGGSVTLQATIHNAVSAKLDGDPITLPATVQLAATHIFSLVASGAPGTTPAGATANVVVAAPLPAPSAIEVKPVNLARTICAPGYFGGGSAYDRYQLVTALTGPTTLQAITHDNNAFGSAMLLALNFDGKPLATATTVATSNKVVFNVDPGSLSEGWHRMSITGAAGWDTIDHFAYVQKGAKAIPQATMPVSISSYSLLESFDGVPHAWQGATVPAVWNPTTQPLVPRACPNITGLPFRHMIAMTQLVINRTYDLYRPSVTASGIMSTANRQDYFYYDFEEIRLPMLPMLDGPRGKGNLFSPQALEIGRNGKVYFCDTWRFGKVGVDGQVTTLAGWRSVEPPSYWNEPGKYERVGDWSAVPADRRGFWQMWGFAWDQRTLATDPNATPIGGEQPHITGPVVFVADMKSDRICRLEFSPTDHAAPAKITEFITGLGNPWQVIYDAGKLYVSERTGNKISTWDATTGALLGSFPVTSPEGMALQDGWLYYGSVTGSRTIRKRNLSTGEDVLFVDLMKVKDPTYGPTFTFAAINGNSRFCNLAISDGTFGPRGMVGMCTWSNLYYGLPTMFAPDGTYHDWRWAPNSSVLPGQSWPGNNGNPANFYPSAIAFGQGRMVCGASNEGLLMFSAPIASDMKTPTQPYLDGMKEWYAKGYQLTHGQDGFGFYGLPPPWGASANIDAFLTVHGHVKG